jgi:hypothetical protein
MSKKDLLLGLAIGAAVTYFTEPRRGRWRGVRATGTGLFTATRSRWRNENADRRVLERVRAKLDQTSSRAQAIHVTSTDGIVTLRGPILSTEVDDVMAAVWSVRGVLAVNNAMEAHQSPWEMPGLQIDGWGFAPTADEPVRRWKRTRPALMTAAGLAATGFAMAAVANRSRNHANTARSTDFVEGASER